MSYFESRLRVDFNNIFDIRNKLEICEKLHIKNLILEPIDNLQRITRDIKDRVRNMTNINVYYRYNLTSKSIKEFRNDIKKYRNFSGILSIESSNKDVQIHAVRDSRIDLLSFSHLETIKTLTDGVISLTKQNNSFIEFSLSSIMVKNRSIQSKNFRNLYRFIHKVRNLKANYILSGDPNELFDIRHPRALISICYTLLDIPLAELKSVFKENPVKLLKKIEKRQDSTILENGVKLIRNGGL